MPVRQCSGGALLLLVLLAAVAAVALLTMIAPARAASAARGVRACTSLVQPDAHAIAAFWECMLEVVSSLELVHLHRAAPTSAEALTGRQTHNVVPAGTLDSDPGERPARSIFWASRAPWYRDVSELPHHDEMPPRAGS